MGNDTPQLASEPMPVSTTTITHLGTLTLMQANNQYCLLKTDNYSDPFLMEDQYRKLKNRLNKATPHVLDLYQLNKQELK